VTCHLCDQPATREMLVADVYGVPTPPLEHRAMCHPHADRLQAMAARDGILLAHVPIYEPPTATPLGNMHDLLAEVCAPHPEDDDA
jgi:hypothetical protein